MEMDWDGDKERDLDDSNVGHETAMQIRREALKEMTARINCATVSPK